MNTITYLNLLIPVDLPGFMNAKPMEYRYTFETASLEEW